MATTTTAATRTTTAMLLAALLSAAAAGCGGDKTGNVSGMVKFQDKPMPGGFINFYSVDADGKVIAHKPGTIGDDGSYAVAKVPIGSVKITVQAPPGALEQNKTAKGGMPRRGKPPVILPPQYQSVEQTDLKYTVRPGGQKHDVVMK